MKRTSFVTLVGLGATVALVAPRSLFSAGKVRSITRLGRPDRALLVGFAGGCSSRRSASAFAGYTRADFD